MKSSAPGAVSKSQILIVSHDIVGPKMAGPGIRYWALADVLSRWFPLILATPEGSSIPDDRADVDLRTYERSDWSYLSNWVGWADAIVIPGDSILEFPQFEACETPIVIDGYDPHTEETLFLHIDLKPNEALSYHSARLDVLSRQCLLGDFFICASESQRLWWLGLLEAHGRINPYTFQEDPALRSLVDLVPFGLPSEPFSGGGFASELPHLDQESKVLLWGGGLWEWLDPLTAIRAMPDILKAYPHTKLLFPGTCHPNPDMPPSPMVERAKALTRSLDLAGRGVVFGDWVSRDVWNQYLRRADVGLSLHPDTIEAKLAFRSRLFDYIWAGLPMVVTRGDETSRLVSQYTLGQVVDFGDADGVAEAVIAILKAPLTFFHDGFEQAREALTWRKAARPLIEFCKHPRRAPDKIAGVVGNRYYQRELSKQAETMAQMQDTIEKYERGKFMRLMRLLKRLRQAIT